MIDLAHRAISKLSNENSNVQQPNANSDTDQTSCKAGELTIYDFGNDNIQYYFEHQLSL